MDEYSIKEDRTMMCVDSSPLMSWISTIAVFSGVFTTWVVIVMVIFALWNSDRILIKQKRT